MIHKKVIALLILSIFCSESTLGQQFFKDSTICYALTSVLQISESPHWAYKDQVKIETIHEDTVFYVIERELIKDKGARWKNVKFLLMEYSNRLFCSGAYYRSNFTDSFFINNVLVYDYNLIAGDTFHFNIDSVTRQEYYVIDSVGNHLLLDGSLKKAQYFTLRGKKYFNSLSLGSNYGGLLSFMDLIVFNNGELATTEVISICHNDTILYQSNDRFTKLLKQEWCDNDTVENAIKQYFSGVKNVLLEHKHVYPNPVKNVLHIRNFAQGAYAIFDLNGKEMKSAVIDSNQIDVSTLNSGTYILVLTNKEGSYRSKILVE
jgi:Secretion system C-terminal sorting domain